jgi:hypothetical protein
VTYSNRFARFLGLAAGLLCLPMAAHAQGVHVALVPADTTVAPGSEFSLRLSVTQSGSAFNGYEGVVAYDPGALTFEQLSPISLQESAYFKDVCGNTFHQFLTYADSMKITDVLLCANQSLTGPGGLYKIKFLASTTSSVTQVRVARIRFVNAGFRVLPVFTADAIVRIGTPIDAPPAARDERLLRLEAFPNPFNPTTLLRVESGRTGPQALVVRDALGHPVRLLQRGSFPAGVRQVVFDGRDDSGAKLASGFYLAVLTTPGHTAVERLLLLK